MICEDCNIIVGVPYCLWDDNIDSLYGLRQYKELCYYVNEIDSENVPLTLVYEEKEQFHSKSLQQNHILF